MMSLCLCVSCTFIAFLMFCFSDPIFEMTVEEGDALLEASKQTWNEQDRALQIDISVLQWVEDLELKVVGADLQLKVRNACDVRETFRLKLSF